MGHPSTPASTSSADAGRSVPLVTLLCGPAGAGKSTVARALSKAGAVRLSMDAELYLLGYPGGTGPSEVLERVHRNLQGRLNSALADGRDVVVDLSLSTRQIRDEWRSLAGRAGAHVELVVLTAPLSVLWDRMQQRQHVDDADAVSLDYETLRGYVEGFEWPSDDEPHRLIDTG